MTNDEGRMTSLSDIIRERIRREGPISFESFMEMALYHPGLGYYAREVSPVGRDGDYYTGPHTHVLFGAMMGKQMEEMWSLLDEPRRFTVVEMGAGAGHLAADLLDYLRGRPLYECLRYVIIEPNPFFRHIQRALLKSRGHQASWHREPGSMASFTGCFLSNELLDSLPVRLVEMNEELLEIYVDAIGAGLRELKRPASPETRQYLDEFRIFLPSGYRTEINLRIRDLLSVIRGRLHAGFVLTADYGFPAAEYYGPARNRGTLLCYRRHQAGENPLAYPGEQDITAHVNFSSLHKWGGEMGFETLGYAAQGTYLVSMGIHELLPGYVGNPPDPVALARAKQLIMPEGMGETHKMMIQAKGPAGFEISGYALRNEMARL